MKKTKSFSKIILGTALLCLTGTNAMAAEQINSGTTQEKGEIQQNNNLIKEFVEEFNQHSDELIVTPENPYKEIKLSNGYTLFAELKPGQQTNTTNKGITAQATQKREFTSTHGYKNLVGMVVLQLETTTKWTFDYDKVLSGSTSVIAEPKGLGWSLRSKTVDSPFYGEDNRYWEWTASGVFAYNVVGVEFDTIELITHHRAKYDGTYSWKYEVVD
ncbi:hypothetical protein [Brevibacillus laterosporus]|uniref:hypothetical protein n=1 Tax=Brevibacillus laterosporus TaxID=1465 RepID=UPI000EB155ED|nr:hypothetical protein [Brevibacillus laterosporus]AYK08637.1 hypothetical protein D8Z77_21020 [Brevibacillus laterosporus]